MSVLYSEKKIKEKKLLGSGIAECRQFLAQISYSEMAVNHAANALSFAVGLDSIKRLQESSLNFNMQSLSNWA